MICAPHEANVAFTAPDSGGLSVAPVRWTQVPQTASPHRPARARQSLKLGGADRGRATARYADTPAIGTRGSLLDDVQVTEEMVAWPVWDRPDTVWLMMQEHVRHGGCRRYLAADSTCR